MYSTLGYLYQQKQQVIFADTGAEFSTARYAIVYAKPLTFNRGVDNVILFSMVDQEQKPKNLSGSTFVFRLISQDGKRLLLEKSLVSLSDQSGRARLTVAAADLDLVDPQKANWSLQRTSGVLNEPVFVDDRAGAQGFAHIVDSVLPVFVDSQSVTIPSMYGDSAVEYSSQIAAAGKPLTTVQFVLDDFTGKLSMEGSDFAATQWYAVEFDVINQLQEQLEYFALDVSGSLAFNIKGHHALLRVAIEADSGEIKSILIR